MAVPAIRSLAWISTEASGPNESGQRRRNSSIKGPKAVRALLTDGPMFAEFSVASRSLGETVWADAMGAFPR